MPICLPSVICLFVLLSAIILHASTNTLLPQKKYIYSLTFLFGILKNLPAISQEIEENYGEMFWKDIFKPFRIISCAFFEKPLKMELLERKWKQNKSESGKRDSPLDTLKQNLISLEPCRNNIQLSFYKPSNHPNHNLHVHAKAV